VKYFKFLVVIFLLPLFSCDNDDNATTNQPSNTCGEAVIVNQNKFEYESDDAHTVNSVTLEGNCLIINFSASGCDGSNWEVKLIASEAVAESLPPQRYLRISLLNPELCDAYITKTIDFDISGVQIDESPILLNFEDYEDAILYEY